MNGSSVFNLIFARQLSAAIVLFYCLSIQVGLDAARLKRLVGGSDAKPNEIFYQASLRVDNYHVCGGTIISQKHILTAAHCVANLFEPPYEELMIVTGTTSLRKSGNYHKVFNISCHPKFANGPTHSWLNDIAIITLTREIKENEKQRGAQLPTSSIPLNANATISGWGRTSTKNPFLSSDLKKASIKILNPSECQKFHKHAIRNGQICGIAAKNVGICKGDSGGPMAVNGTIIGISSWNIPCATGIPDVYTNVYDYLDFIKQIIYKK